MRYLKISLVVLSCLLCLNDFAPNVQAQDITLEEHLETLSRELLQYYNIAGIAIMVFENSDVAYQKLFGFSDMDTKAEVNSFTVFNVGSISKPMTAWGIMHLVRKGKLDLDNPVNNYLKSMKLRSDSINTAEITIRELLSHTAGLSLAAVPEYSQDEITPGLTSYLNSTDDLFFKQKPGTGWSYSGGGYMILQQIIEDITGKKFAVYMKEDILEPLGMTQTGYTWTPELERHAATPYNEGIPTEYFKYVGQAAASLNSTLNDMGKWMKTTFSLLNGHSQISDVLDPITFRSMIQPAPASLHQFGISYGLGYELWPTGKDTYLTGHNGQNTGWTSGFWFNPATGDGLVVLINDSEGYNTWRWIFCDWMYWTTEIRWRGICSERPDELSTLNISR